MIKAIVYHKYREPKVNKFNSWDDLTIYIYKNKECVLCYEVLYDNEAA
jgi:hypothetical protein